MAGDPTEAVVRAILLAMRIPPDDAGSIGDALDDCVRSAVDAAIAAERAACEAVVRAMRHAPASVADEAWTNVHNHALDRAADAIAARGKQ